MEQEHIKRPRRTSSEITKLLEQFNESGTSAKEFCSMHNITEAGFYKWRIRYGDRSPGKQNAFVVLPKPPALIHGPSLFAEVKGIKIYQAVGAAYLKELLA